MIIDAQWFQNSIEGICRLEIQGGVTIRVQSQSAMEPRRANIIDSW